MFADVRISKLARAIFYRLHSLRHLTVFEAAQSLYTTQAAERSPRTDYHIPTICPQPEYRGASIIITHRSLDNIISQA